MPKGVYDRKTALDQADAPEIATIEDAIAAAQKIEEPVAREAAFKGALAAIQKEGIVPIDDLRAEMARELAEVKALKAKLELQTAVRSEVSEALRLQQEEARRQQFGKIIPSQADVMPPKPDEKLISIKLERNYRPAGYYEVAGWHKEEIKRKNAAGQMVVVERAEFIEGERKPPAVAGTGFANKHWAGQVLRVPETEARTIRKLGIGSIELD